MKNFVIIPSGGKGLRSGRPIPKQYVQFKGKELIAYTLEVFQNSPKIHSIAVSAEEEYFSLLEKIKKKYNITKLDIIAQGGNDRQESVYNALKQLKAEDDDLVAVHDAVRPLLSRNVLNLALDVAKTNGAAVVAVKAKDTLIKGDDIVGDYLNRDEIYYAQTPQIFHYKILLNAMNLANESGFRGTDESMLVKNASYNVKIVEGSSFNFKITSPDDLQLFGLLCDKITI